MRESRPDTHDKEYTRETVRLLYTALFLAFEHVPQGHPPAALAGGTVPTPALSSVFLVNILKRQLRLARRRFHELGTVAELLRVNDVADDVVDLVGITQRVPADDREQLPREQLDTIRFAELLGEDLALRGEAQRALGDDLLALLAPRVARLGALDVGDARALCGLALPDRRLCKGTPNESILLASQLWRARCAVCACCSVARSRLRT